MPPTQGRKERYRNSPCAKAKAKVRAEMEVKQKAAKEEKDYARLDDHKSPSCVMDRALPMQIKNSLVAQTPNHPLDAEWIDELITLRDF